MPRIQQSPKLHLAAYSDFCAALGLVIFGLLAIAGPILLMSLYQLSLLH